MRNFTKIILFSSVTLLWASCAEKEDIRPLPDNASDSMSARKCISDTARLIGGHNFKVYEVARTQINGIDGAAFFPSCNLDNIVYLYADGKYREMEGPDRCDRKSQVYDKGHYTLNGNGTITLVTDNVLVTFEILKITENEFWVKDTNPEFPMELYFRVRNK